MKKLLVLFWVATFNLSYGQNNIGIGTDSPHVSAKLEVASTTMGFLPPRMTYAQRNAIVTPAAGLIIFCTNCGANGQLQNYDGVNWLAMVNGIGYGPPAIPSLTTQAVSSITQTTAVSGYTISAEVYPKVTIAGVVWSTSANPTITLPTKTTNGSANITGLSPGTTYHVRAYATNSLGTGYGNEIVFTTQNATVPVLTTQSVAVIRPTTALGGGNVTSTGNSSITTYGIVWSNSPNPTIALNTKTAVSPGGVGNYKHNLSNLSSNTTYYVRAYATNGVGTAYGNEVSFTTLPDYPTTTICNQVWMTKNLDLREYNNGDLITGGIIDNFTWGSGEGVWCWYNDDSIAYGSTYGRLYNWKAVTDARGLAPIGWHIPSDSEWIALSYCLGGDSIAGGKLKAITSLWHSPNTGATNSSGFSALPGGYRRADFSAANPPVYLSNGNEACFWTSTIQYAPNSYAYYRELSAGSGSTYRLYDATMYGFSVRCIKD